MNIKTQAKTALRERFTGEPDGKGYTLTPQENLIQGVQLRQFEDDLHRGDGNELRMKFCAVHSSSALAVNCFARFKEHPEYILLLGQKGAKKLEFEKQLRIFDGGRAPNIDVWIERDWDVVAIESKLLEYLTQKKPKFSESYERLAPPISESCWWDVYIQAKQGAEQYLDRAQLVKHYFGLNEYRKKNQQIHITLLYIFWEPLNWSELEVCKQHREEVKNFADAVSESQIPFHWITYNDLWKEWSVEQALKKHTQNLIERYQLCL